MLWQAQEMWIRQPNPNLCFCDLPIASLYPSSPAYARVAEMSHTKETATRCLSTAAKGGEEVETLMPVLWALMWGFRQAWLSFLPREAFDLLL